MESFGDGPRRVDVAYKALRDALADDRSGRWYELNGEDANVLVDLSQVVFVRLDTQEQRIGFRGA